jgi:stage V sporulation protein G
MADNGGRARGGGRAMTETVGVEYRVIGIAPIRGTGSLVGMAIVEVEIAGVVLTIQGIRIMRRQDGSLEVGAPTFKSPRDGRSIPAILLPDALRNALADEIIDSWRRITPT